MVLKQAAVHSFKVPTTPTGAVHQVESERQYICLCWGMSTYIKLIRKSDFESTSRFPFTSHNGLKRAHRNQRNMQRLRHHGAHVKTRILVLAMRRDTEQKC